MINVDATGERLVVVTEKIKRFRAALVTLCQSLIGIEGRGVLVFNFSHHLASQGINSHGASRREVCKEDFVRSFRNHSPVRDEVRIRYDADSIQISTNVIGDERLAAGIEQQLVAVLRGRQFLPFQR